MRGLIKGFASIKSIKNYVRDINGYLRLNLFSLITGNQHLSNAGSFYLFYQKGREAGKGSGRKQALRDVLNVIHEKTSCISGEGV